MDVSSYLSPTSFLLDLSSIVVSTSPARLPGRCSLSRGVDSRLSPIRPHSAKIRLPASRHPYSSSDRSPKRYLTLRGEPSSAVPTPSGRPAAQRVMKRRSSAALSRTSERHEGRLSLLSFHPHTSIRVERVKSRCFRLEVLGPFPLSRLWRTPVVSTSLCSPGRSSISLLPSSTHLVTRQQRSHTSRTFD